MIKGDKGIRGEKGDKGDIGSFHTKKQNKYQNKKIFNVFSHKSRINNITKNEETHFLSCSFNDQKVNNFTVSVPIEMNNSRVL